MKHQGDKLSASSVKEAINPYDFYLSEQNLCQFGQRSGPWAIAGLCPFHADSKQGSFKVNLTSGAFRCWSCGAHGGDIIAFVMQKQNLSFKECLEWAVNMEGIR